MSRLGRGLGRCRGNLLHQQQLVEVGEAGLELLDPLLVGPDPGGDRRHRAPQFAGAAVQGLGFSHLLPAGIGQTQQAIGLALQGATALHLVEPLLLLPALGLLLGQGLLEAQAQAQGALLQAAAVQLPAVVGLQEPIDLQGLRCQALAGLGLAGLEVGRQRLNPRRLLLLRFCSRIRPLLPAAVGRGLAGAEGKRLARQHRQPALPAAMQLLPLGFAQLVHGTGQQVRSLRGLVAGQLQGQGRADALIGLAQGPAQGHRHQAQPPPPVGIGLGGPGRLALGRRRRQIGIAATDRPQPRLLLTHLAGGAGDPPLAIEHKQVAVAAHQLQHQAAANRVPGPRRELQLHHPLHPLLLQSHQGQARETVLHLLGQGAAIAAAGGRGDREEPGGFGLPAQFQPVAADEAAETQLQGLAIALLGLLKPARQQQGP